MLVIILVVVYGILDMLFGVMAPWYVYLSFLTFGLINVFLLRNGYVEFSKVYSLLAFNSIIYFVAISEPFSTGMYLHFVTAGSVALAVYGFEQWKGAIGFVVLSLLLHFAVFVGDFSILPYREIPTDQANFFFITNTLIAVIVCVYSFLMYSKINYETEKALKDNSVLIKKQNEELKKANDELDRFVYSASHDLRAPLSTLTGLINLSNSEKDEKLKLEYLGMMKERIHSMDNFISEIIDYSRNTRLELSEEKIVMEELIDEILEDLKYMDGHASMEIEKQFSPDTYVLSDKVRLKMVFANLISNSIKYRDKAKEKCWTRITGQNNGAECTIKIEDNGSGMGEEHLDKIFDMFYRAHENSSGSGLGLYIVRESLQKLGGTVSVTSNQTVGSEFTIKIPVKIPTLVLSDVPK